jgi:hypothetical protein
MRKILWGLMLAGLMYGVYLWANAEVPGGEKRYEQYVRLLVDRHGGNAIPKISAF